LFLHFHEYMIRIRLLEHYNLKLFRNNYFVKILEFGFLIGRTLDFLQFKRFSYENDKWINDDSTSFIAEKLTLRNFTHKANCAIGIP